MTAPFDSADSWAALNPISGLVRFWPARAMIEAACSQGVLSCVVIYEQESSRKNFPMKPLIISCLMVMTGFASRVTAEDTRCFEMRTYYANEGKLDALNARFRDHTLKLFEKHGFTNIGYWVPKDNTDNALIYVISSADRAAHDKAWQQFLADEDWKKAYKESVAAGKLVGRIKSVYLKATDYSPKIESKKTDAKRIFELRTYTTNEGKLPNLNARFRDHTVKLFQTHGLPNFAYWTPVAEKDGRDNKLIYILAHESEESRASGFKAFGQDPAWTSARKASEADGKLLVKKGVKSVLMKPTDYSPTR